MSLILYGINSLGSIAYSAGSTVLQRGKGLVQVVCATPEAIKNGTVAVVSAVVNGTLQVASSTTTAIKNTASSAVNGTVDKAKSTAADLRKGAVHLLNAGKDAAIATAVQNYAELFFRIHTVGNKLVNDFSTKQPISQVNRNELAERLEELVALPDLKEEDKCLIANFCKELRNESIAFDEAKLGEMRILEKILNPYFNQHKNYIQSKIAEREQLEKLPGLTTLPSPKLTSEQTLSGIQAQVDLLKSNSIKMILGSIVLNMTLGVNTFEGIDCKAAGIAPPDGSTNLINFLIEVSNQTKIEGKSSEEVFQDLMYKVIDHSGKNIFIRIHAKMRSGFVFALVMNLVGNIFDNLKATLVHFAHLPPAKQLEELTHLLINPLLDQLSAIDGSQPGASTPKTADELLDQFITAFLAQFIDRKYQPWSRNYRAICIEKASRSDLVGQVFYSTLSVLLWIAGKLTAPIHWAVNETIHGVLKSVIVNLCPSLSDATKQSLEIGTDNAWYSLKNSLLLLLQQVRLTALLPRANDPVYQPSKELPHDVKEKLTTILDKLFKVLAPQDESRPTIPKLMTTLGKLFKVLAPPEENQASAEGKPTFSAMWSEIKLMFCEEDLNKLLETPDGKTLIALLQQNMHGEFSGLKDIIKTALSELILDLVAEDDFLNGTLLSSLTSINASGFASRSAPVVSTEEKQRVEIALQKELGLLGGNILQAVNESTRTDRSYQTSANIHITVLKQQVAAFNQNLLQIQNNPDLSFKKSVLAACTEFGKSMEKLEAEITKSVDAPTKALLMPHLNQAQDIVRKISDNLYQCPIKEKRKQVEAKLNELYPLFKIPLDNQKEIIKVIEELRNLDASFLDVEALVEELNEYHQIYLERLVSPTGRTQPPSAYTKPFFVIVADYKDMANTAAAIAAKAQIKQLMPSIITSTIESAAQLANWANELQFVKVTTKPTAKDVGMTAVYNLPLLKAVTSAGLQSYGKNLFTFLGDEKNLAGIAQRGMEAFLSKPRMMPKKERPKVGIFALTRKKNSKVHPLSPEELKKLTAKKWEVINE